MVLCTIVVLGEYGIGRYTIRCLVQNANAGDKAAGKIGPMIS